LVGKQHSVLNKTLKNPSKLISKVTNLSNSYDLRSVVINSGWLIGDKVARLGLGLIIGVWVARYLGPEQYGVLAFAIAFLSIFQAFAALGLDNVVVRQIAQAPESANTVLGTALTLRLVASSLSLMLATLVGFIIYRDDLKTLVILLLVASGIIFQSADIIDLWFQSQSESRRTVVAKAVAYACAAVIKVGLIIRGAPLWAFAAAQSTELAISAAALCFSYRHFKVQRPWLWQASTARALMTQSFPFLLSGLSIVVYLKSSQLFISQLLDQRALGLYSTAQVLSELWYFLPMTIATSVAPAIARRKVVSALAYSSAMQWIFGFMWVLSIVLSTLICLNASWIVTLLYGKAYDGAAAVLAVHTFTLIPVSIGVIQSLWLVNENKGRIAIYQTLAGAVLSMSLSFLLIPKFGIVGGAVAMLSSQIIQAFVVCSLFAPALLRLQFRSLLFAATTIASSSSAAFAAVFRK
jgi:O-antigen/teichoic acid export membrane protein